MFKNKEIKDFALKAQQLMNIDPNAFEYLKRVMEEVKNGK